MSKVFQVRVREPHVIINVTYANRFIPQLGKLRASEGQWFGDFTHVPDPGPERAVGPLTKSRAFPSP